MPTLLRSRRRSRLVAIVTFPGVAPYTVTLRVTDGRGSADEASFVVEVGG